MKELPEHSPPKFPVHDDTVTNSEAPMQDIQTTNSDPVPPARPDTPIACDVSDWVTEEPNLPEEETRPTAVVSAGPSQANESAILAPVEEADFQPDYVEEREPDVPPTSIKDLITNAVQAVNLHMVSDLLERPSLVATAVTGVSSQLLHTTNQLSSIATSLDHVVKELGNKKESSVFADLRKELKSLNANTGFQRDEIAKLRRVVKDVVDAEKSGRPRLVALLESLNTSITTFTTTMGQLSAVLIRDIRSHIPASAATPSGDAAHHVTPRARSPPKKGYHYNNTYRNLRK